MPNLEQDIDRLLRSPIKRWQWRVKLQTIVVVSSFMVVQAYAGFWYHRAELTRVKQEHIIHGQRLPLTREQKKSLTDLAQRVSERLQVTRQSVWANLKSRLGIYRIDDITQGDLERARAFLKAMKYEPQG